MIVVKSRYHALTLRRPITGGLQGSAVSLGITPYQSPATQRYKLSAHLLEMRSDPRYRADMSAVQRVPLEIAGKRFKFHPRAYMSGNTLVWLCARCGKINRTVMSAGLWRTVCKRSSCHLAVVIGFRFGILSRHSGPRPPLPPRDAFIPADGRELSEAFPECELFEWRSGQPAHRLL